MPLINTINKANPFLCMVDLPLLLFRSSVTKSKHLLRGGGQFKRKNGRKTVGLYEIGKNLLFFLYAPIIYGGEKAPPLRDLTQRIGIAYSTRNQKIFP